MSQLKVDSIIPVGGVASGQAGGVVQVFQYSTTTLVDTTGTTYVDTTLSGSITPLSATNKILVFVDQQLAVVNTGTGSGGGLRVLRDSTTIHDGGPQDGTGPFPFFMSGNSSTLYYYFRHHINVLDSPGTTSSITYKTQMRCYSSVGTTVRAQRDGSALAGKSYLTLMEVSA